MKINEVVSRTPPADSVVELAAKVKELCQPYLTEIEYDLFRFPLYRGLKAYKTEPFVVPCPVDREPIDTPLEVHEVADDFFFKKTGVAYRSNALFCSGSMSMARDYGTVYVAFPIGDFSFCWSPRYQDLYKQVENNLTDEDGPRGVMDLLHKGKYVTRNLQSAIISSNEIMLHCDALLVKYLTEDGLYINQEIMRVWGNESK